MKTHPHLALALASLIALAIAATDAIAADSHTRAFYPFNEPGGLTVSNTSSRGVLDGTLEGSATRTNFSMCGNNSSLILDGLGGYVQLPANVLDNLSAGTFEAWVYLLSYHPNASFIVSKGDANLLTEFSISVFDPTFPPERAKRIAAGAMGSPDILVSNTRIELGQWYKIAFTWDGQLWRLYVNDSFDSEMASTRIPVASPHGPTLGWHRHTTNPRFHGYIEDVEISDVARTFCANTNLIAEYKFEEATGGVALDSSCHEHDGTLQNGPTRVPSESGKAIIFDGFDDSVQLPPAVVLNRPGAFEASIRLLSYHAVHTIIVSKGDANQLTEFQVGVLPPTETHERAQRLQAGAFGSPDTIVSNTRIELGQWYQIGFTWDGQYWRLYVNGNLDAEIPSTRLPVASSHGPTLGWQRHVINPHFHGLMDNVRFSHTLAPSLNIRRAIVLDYPTWATNYVLQSTRSLRPPICWQPVSQSPVLEGNRIKLFVETDGMDFFRLAIP